MIKRKNHPMARDLLELKARTLGRLGKNEEAFDAARNLVRKSIWKYIVYMRYALYVQSDPKVTDTFKLLITFDCLDEILRNFQCLYSDTYFYSHVLQTKSKACCLKNTVIQSEYYC